MTCTWTRICQSLTGERFGGDRVITLDSCKMGGNELTLTVAYRLMFTFYSQATV